MTLWHWCSNYYTSILILIESTHCLNVAQYMARTQNITTIHNKKINTKPITNEPSTQKMNKA